MPPAKKPVLEAAVRSGKIGPLYLLVGQETFGREKALSELLDSILAPAARTFNLDVFRGGEVDPADVVDRALCFPMGCPRRVVVIKESDHLNEQAAQILIPLVESPPETTTMIFVCDKADRRRKLFSLLERTAQTVSFDAVNAQEILSWIKGRITASGKGISQGALRVLCERAGEDLGVVAGEVEKLLAFAGDRGVIEEEDVERVVGFSESSSIFDLTDAVGAKDPGLALAMLRKNIEGGERSGGIIYRLSRHVDTLMKVRMLKDLKVPQREIPSRLGLRSPVASKFLNQARKYSYPDLWRAYEALVVAEDHLKSGYQNEEIVLQLLVVGLCR